MGGFFLACVRPDEDRTAKLASLRDAFAELGFADPEVIDQDHYVFAAYPKLGSRSVELRRYPNGDFVFVCGTCIGEHGVGSTAAAELYRCFGSSTAPAVRDALMGHYACVLKKDDTSAIILDTFGGYHVFYNLAAGIVSSSFYAVCSVLDRLTVRQRQVCEYVFNGIVSGNETLFAEVEVAPIGGTIRIEARELEVDRPALPVTTTYTTETRAASVEHSIALLDRYFVAATRSFSDRTSCALSGGYDSRLILAFLRRHGVKPRIHVYGTGADEDVRVAMEIAAGERLSLDVINKADRPTIPPEKFPAVAYANFLADDAVSNSGIFNNGAEIVEMARRVSGDAIAFNGGGGEIFRNFFHLPDREYTVRELLWSFYSQFDPDVCTPRVDVADYYAGLEKKIVELLGNHGRSLARPTVEWLYHRFRCRAWDGGVDSIAARYGATAMPYLERSITEHASALPLPWKNHGSFEAELIRRVDPRLARYRSVYGHDFARPAPLSRRLGYYATYLRPPWLRRYTHRVKHVPRPPDDWPGYLARPYRQAVLSGGPMMLERLFRLDRVGDPSQFARIFSLEYALRQFGARITADF
jgi:hypothetical protein